MEVPVPILAALITSSFGAFAGLIYLKRSLRAQQRIADKNNLAAKQRELDKNKLSFTTDELKTRIAYLDEIISKLLELKHHVRQDDANGGIEFVKSLHKYFETTVPPSKLPPSYTERLSLFSSVVSTTKVYIDGFYFQDDFLSQMTPQHDYKELQRNGNLLRLLRASNVDTVGDYLCHIAKRTKSQYEESLKTLYIDPVDK